MDIFTPKKRSEIMKTVKGTETAIEKDIRAELTKAGIRYRKNDKTLEGKPDIAFKGKKIVVFIDSCFWHGCPRHFTKPKTNAEFWEKKIARNKERDKEVTREYKKAQWHVIRLWEHNIKKDTQKAAQKIISAYESNTSR